MSSPTKSGRELDTAIIAFRRTIRSRPDHVRSTLAAFMAILLFGMAVSIVILEPDRVKNEDTSLSGIASEVLRIAGVVAVGVSLALDHAARRHSRCRGCKRPHTECLFCPDCGVADPVTGESVAATDDEEAMSAATSPSTRLVPSALLAVVNVKSERGHALIVLGLSMMVLCAILGKIEYGSLGFWGLIVGLGSIVLGIAVVRRMTIHMKCRSCEKKGAQQTDGLPSNYCPWCGVWNPLGADCANEEAAVECQGGAARQDKPGDTVGESSEESSQLSTVKEPC